MNEIPNQLQAFSVEIVERLREAGHEAYWAGGCVRDLVLKHVPKDYDVATSARPDEIREIFGRRRTLTVGAAFGVIAVLGPKGQPPVEVATFREDASYSDGRHPDAVTYSTPQADAQRRDFTINGMFYDPIETRVHDWVGGQADLAAGVVRAIGDPDQRIAEDKLRMLRAVRFAATFGFEIEQHTLRAVIRHAPAIDVVSKERIAAELKRILEHPHRHRGLVLLRATGLWDHVLPELGWIADGEHEAIWSETCAVLSALQAADFATALAGLIRLPMQQEGHRKETVRGLARLRFAKQPVQHALWMVDHERHLLHAGPASWPTVQRCLAHPLGRPLLELMESVVTATGASRAGVLYCQQRMACPESEWNPPPLISGDDLLARGMSAGPRFREVLERIRDDQLNGRIDSAGVAIQRAEEIWHTLAESDAPPDSSESA